MKKCNKIIVRVLCGAVGIFCITLVIMLVIPYSRFYAGECIKVEMCVTEGEEYLIPENIVCMRGVENSDIPLTREGKKHKYRGKETSSYHLYTRMKEQKLEIYLLSLKKPHNSKA